MNSKSMNLFQCSITWNELIPLACRSGHTDCGCINVLRVAVRLYGFMRAIAFEVLIISVLPFTMSQVRSNVRQCGNIT